MSTGTEKINAVNELRRFANGFRNLLAVADDLERLGQIENAEAEAKARLDALMGRIATAARELERIEAGRAAAEAECNKRREQAEAEAAQIIAAAKEQAQRRLTEIEARAEALLARAKNDADAVASATIEAREKLKALEAEIAAKTAQLDDINRQREALRARL